MTMRPIPISLAVILSLAIPAMPASAEQHPNLERGFQPEKAYQIGDVDHVNLLTGNLVVTIPVGPRYRVGGALEYGFTLVNNSKAWDWEMIGPKATAQAKPSYDSNTGFGWQLHLGRVIPPLTPPRNDEDRWLYLAPDGSEHFFDRTLEIQEGDFPCGQSFAGPCYTRDGSYLRLKRFGNAVEVEFGNGVRHRFEPWGERDELWLVRMEDSFGNWMAVNYAANPWTVSDSTGRSHKISFTEYHDGMNSAPVSTVTKLELAKFGGGYGDPYKLHYLESQEVERPALHDSENNGPASIYVPLLVSLELPDGSAWRMPADFYVLERGDGSGASTGSLKRLRLPTGGMIAWTYANYTFATDFAPDPGDHIRRTPFLRHSPGVTQRQVLRANGSVAGTWTYDSHLTMPQASSQHKPTEISTTVVDPLGHTTVSYFSVWEGAGVPDPEGDGELAEPWHYGLPFSLRRPDGAGRYLSREVVPAAGSEGDRQDWVRYENDAINQRVVASKTLWDGRWRSEDYGDYDGLGHYRWVEIKNDFPNDCPKSRREYTRFNDTAGTWPNANTPATGAAWLLGEFTYQWEEEDGARRRREYVFDAEGFLTRERIFREWGDARHAQDTVRVITPDNFGNPVLEQTYGGYYHQVGVGELATLSLPGTAAASIETTIQSGQPARRKYTGAPFYLLDLTIDASTGLPSSSRDVAGVPTFYTYDDMGRMTWAKHENDAWIEYDFTPSDGTSQAKVGVYERLNGSPQGNPLRESEFHFDEMGQLRRERKALSTGWSERRRYHDAQGNLASISEWESESDFDGFYTRFNHMDPSGRPREILAPDGRRTGQRHNGNWGSQRWWYVVTSGDGVTYNDGATNESNKQEVSQDFDAMGRLCRVQEKDGLDARYLYTVRGDLASVSLKWGPNAGNRQDRSFVYDARGFLKEETHPETGTFLYEAIDARGHATIKRHQASGLGLDLEYDAYERLIKVRDRLEDRDIKVWEYGTSNLGTDLRKGKVVKATRYNYRQVPWNQSVWANLPVVEEYAYAGRGGRISSRRTKLNNTYFFDQSWEWDQLGNMTRQVYPRCTTGCSGPAVAARNQTYAYSSGQLAEIDDWAILAYHDNGMVSQVQHDNGVTDFIDKDPHQMMRPSNIRIGTPGGVAELGVHSYDGGGNLFRLRPSPGALTFQQLGPEATPAQLPQAADTYFLYDTLGRIKLHHDQAGTEQPYAYDTLGNATQIGSAAYTVSKATNRLTMASYDPRGNMTSRANVPNPSEVYTWDLVDQLASRNFPYETYLYTVDGERVWTLNQSIEGLSEKFTLRDLGGKVLSLYEKSSGITTWKHDYLHRGNLALGKTTPEPAPNDRVHFTLDHLGSTRVVTRDNGTTLETHHFFAYGDEFSGNRKSEEKLLFTGHERDKNGTGTVDDLDYMHARYYGPQLGRFLSADPIHSAKLEQPQTWNKYGYAANSPQRYIDPDGRAIIEGHSERLERNRAIRESIKNSIGGIPLVGDSLSELVDTFVLSQVLPATNEEWVEGANASLASVVPVGPLVGPLKNISGSIDDAARTARTYNSRVSSTGVNNIHHIFGQSKHKLDGLVSAFGSKENAYDQLLEATRAAAKSSTGRFEVTVKVGGYTVTVRGKIVNGQPRIGTAFIP
jgi:RHS repeat-associated protein